MKPSEHIYPRDIRSSAWPFYIRNIGQLRAEAERLGLALRFSEDIAVLNAGLLSGNTRVPNRWCALPLSGNDAQPDGAPSPLTTRRYIRYASGGFGMIWVEGAAINTRARTRRNMMMISDENIKAFADFTSALRRAAAEHSKHDPLIILQLAHDCLNHPPAPVETNGTARFRETTCEDDELDNSREEIIAAAGRAAQAGFDGVDIPCCMDNLSATLLTAFERPGKYGGSLENRSRLLRESLQGIRENHPDLPVAIRLNVYTARAFPHGFGTAKNNYREPDMREPIELAALLQAEGASMLNITSNSPNLQAPPGIRSLYPHFDHDIGDEHPLTTLARNLAITGAMRAAAPNLTIIAGGSGGFGWLENLLPQAAAGVIEGGCSDLIGLGRPALAYPDMPLDIRRTGTTDPYKSCNLCQACLYLGRAHTFTGCVPRDSRIYGNEYRRIRRYAPERLAREAGRCRNCTAPPCRISIPGDLDIPAFIRAFAQDRISDSFAVIRKSNMLPEMSAALALGPPQRTGETNCIETILSGQPVAIRDIMTAVAQDAREKGLSGIRVPSASPTGRKIAVVGGGPAGISAAARLLELGHLVTVFEQRKRMGGVPEILIPQSRFFGATDEINALLSPALKAGRLKVQLATRWGHDDLTLDNTLRSFDAVLIAAGLWQNRPACSGTGGVRGVVDAARFLEQAKAGKWKEPIDSAAVLSGGDCAMDSSTTALRLGARNLYVIFPGPRANMHWCIEEVFFAQPRVHALMLTRPLEYETDGSGCLTGLSVCPMLAEADGSWRDVPQKRHTLNVNMVIEASELVPEDSLAAALKDLRFLDNGLLATRRKDSFHTSMNNVYAAGSLVNGGASVPQCSVDGVRAAEEIHNDLTQQTTRKKA